MELGPILIIEFLIGSNILLKSNTAVIVHGSIAAFQE
jgi:hypothetical protein